MIYYDGKFVRHANHLSHIVEQSPAGKTVTVIVMRDGKEKQLSITVGEKAVESFSSEPESVPYDRELGMTVSDLTKERAGDPDIEPESGVVVTEVQPAGRAAISGIQEGDIIKEVNKKVVINVISFEKALRQMDSKKSFRVYVKRGEVSLYMIIKEQDE
ncbi:MAG: PDZ domain-containing protein [Candidatus Brocadiaceae bacterium]|nr:PDZ domain-containing protein [Candidatus Brocadiaceae bacterium]